MTDIYEQHQKAFARVSAFVVLKDGERVATVAIKYPADGAGRLYAYVHWLGTEMVRGQAGGYGYDKRSAAVADAARKFTSARDNIGYARDVNSREFWGAIYKDGGEYWDRKLRDAGFTVLQAV